MPSLASVAATKAGYAARIPTAPGSHRMRMVGASGTIPAHPIFEIFAPDYWQRQHAGGAFFRDKVVVIGKAGTWLQDDHHTPLGIMQGPEIQLNVINAIIGGEFLSETPPWMDAVIVLLSGVLAIFLTRRIRRPFVRLAALTLGAGLGMLGVVTLYDHAGILLHSATPLATWLLIGGGGFVADVLRERREKAHMRGTLERYVSRGVVEDLLSDQRDLHARLGGEVREVTVLFTDIRDFTYISASTDPTRLVGQLNEYFTDMVECVFAHGGTLDKFMGDALMAVWGNTTSHGPAADARAAVRCALAMRKALAKLNERWRAERYTEFDIGIALNHGAAVCGNIGSPNRMEFTVIGDVVNVAWRLQERSKDHPGQILLGELLPPLVAPEFASENIGAIRVGGSLEVEYARLLAVSEAGPAKSPSPLSHAAGL